jgi:FAD:protein FMN transferase
MFEVLVPLHLAAEHPPVGKLHSLHGLSMGTSWSVRLLIDETADCAEVHQGLQRELDMVVRQMSHWDAGSDLSRFNRGAPGSWHSIPPEFMEVLSYALAVAAQTDGAYDPALGALVNAWGFGPVKRFDRPGFVAPDEAAIAAVMRLPTWRAIEIDARENRVRQPGGVLLDLSAIAKGYAVDRLARYLEQQGIPHYLAEVGGELRGSGMKPDGQPWWVALEQADGAAYGAARAPQALLALHGLSVATSGDYRRCFQAHGKSYAHTLDARTGYPLQNGVASVTVMHQSCMAADAWSTALTVLGVAHGMDLAEEKSLAVRFLLREEGGLVECTSSAYREMLQ